MDYLRAGVLVGAVGDTALQYLCYNNYLFRDLRPYFDYQGQVLSVVKAAALTGFWSWAFRRGYGKDDLLSFALFAGVLDIVYRRLYPVLYPSLSYYYNAYPGINTVAANAGVAALVYATARLFR